MTVGPSQMHADDHFQNFQGLTADEVNQSRATYGRNAYRVKHKSILLAYVIDLAKEPMLLILLTTSILYFIKGQVTDGLFMVTAILLVSGISLHQENKSKKALNALKSFTQTSCSVIRNGVRININPEEVVCNDVMVVEEGSLIPADGVVMQAHDFMVNESILTGESLPVLKNTHPESNRVFQGTTVSAGLAICQVTAVGASTELGKIGKSLADIQPPDTPLQIQIRDFVRKMIIAGSMIFLLVWAINYVRSTQLIDSLLQALTLAMSILPEEIPVAFATFMALGAWKLMNHGIIVKHTTTIETLGSATVICTDKTGTLTENRMTLTQVFDLATNRIATLTEEDDISASAKTVIRTAMWASEPLPFDPMEKSLHKAYLRYYTDERSEYAMVHEYPLSGAPPFMTHVFENANGDRIIAAKGAPEALLRLSHLTDEEIANCNVALQKLSAQGYRVLGVGYSTDAVLHEEQHSFSFTFLGFVAFYDPPKKKMNDVLNAFYKAGIKVKIITGDSTLTTQNIARQIHLRDCDQVITGEQLQTLSEASLRDVVRRVNLFTRMFPDAKLRILNALKANGEIVAMTGDGVNDGPALRAAHIGIAMGKRGAEIAKAASSLILVDDDLGHMVEAIAMGRKIYTNLKKAIQYIISIHIPILLTVFIPLAAGWIYPHIFSPVHIIFFELIMGPTCSIIYENEPMERNAMNETPRLFTKTFFKAKELGTSILQGLIITIGVLLVYQYGVHNGYPEAETRTMVFITLITANCFLTLVNRSFQYSLLATLRYKNNLMPVILGVTLVLTALMILVPAFRNFFHFDTVGWMPFGISVAAGSISVLWLEIVKWARRILGFNF